MFAFAKRGAPMLAVALSLLIPATSSATTAILGSDLQTAPNLPWGCEQTPFIAGYDGSMGLQPSGQADCTWRQTGVFGSTTDTRFSSVPADGRITQVQVRTGPNPAPLRFVVLRQLGNVGGTANSQCCFFKSETLPMPMQPNQVNTFAVNIPVERNTLDGIRAFDLVGISANAGAGSLPLAEVGPHNVNAVLTQGAVDVGYFYPRLGAIPNDAGGGRLESGTSGIELTVRWTWVSADDPGLAPGPGGGGGGGGGAGDPGGAGGDPGGTPEGGGTTGGGAGDPVRVAPALTSTTAKVNAGRAAFALRCAASAGCAGRLQLLAATKARGKGKGRATAAARTVSYGKATYAIKARGRATVKLTLTKAAKRRLRTHTSLAATLRLTPTGGKAVTRKVSLTRPRR